MLVVDCVGSDDTFALAAGGVRPGGHVSLLGLAGGTFPMRFGAVPLETSVIFSNWGTRAELAEVVALAREGVIAIDVERVPLAGVPAAYERLATGATPRPARGRPGAGMSLEGRIAVVTGGGSGIGEAICHRLAADGARVAALDLRLEAAQQTIGAIGEGLAVHADVSDSAAVDAALEHVERELGSIDVVVNNAGAVGAAHLARVMPLLETQRHEALSGGVRTPLDALVRLSDDEWRRLLAVHLDGTFFCTRAAARLMAPRGAGRDREHGLGLRDRGLHRPSPLLGRQGRDPRLHTGGREGADRPGDPCERRRSRARRHRHAQGPARRRAGA